MHMCRSYGSLVCPEHRDELFASQALDMLEQLAPKRAKCACGSWVQSVHKFWHNCKKENASFSQEDFIVHQQGHGKC